MRVQTDLSGQERTVDVLCLLEQDPANISLRNLDTKLFAVLERALVDKYLCIVYYLSFLVKKKKVLSII